MGLHPVRDYSSRRGVGGACQQHFHLSLSQAHAQHSTGLTADSWDPEKWRFTAAASSSELSIVWHIS